MKKATLLRISGVLLVVSFSMERSPRAQQPATPSFVNTIAVGDSFTAGVQNGVLKSQGQVTGYVSLLARQVQTYLFLPLIPEPGFGSEVRLENGRPTVDPPAVSTRTFPLVIPQNLAVPSQGILEALTTRPSLPLDTLEDIILGLPILVVPLGIPPASQIELAVGLQPTFTFFWLGFNDVLVKAVFGGELIPFEVFQGAYIQAVGALLTLTPTQIVVANVPDVTLLPFLTAAEEIAASLGLPLGAIGPALGLEAGDFVRFPALPLVESILSGQLSGPLPESAVLRSADVQALRILTAQMNGLISGLSLQFGFPVVDLHSAFQDLDTNGLEVLGRTLTTHYLGGVFSLDAIHPTNTAHAFIANQFLGVMNNAFGTSFPAVDLETVAASDPLLPSVSPGPSGDWISMFATASLAGMASILGEFPVLDEAGSLDPGEDPVAESNRLAADVDLEAFSQFAVTPGPVYLREPSGSEASDRTLRRSIRPNQSTDSGRN